MQPTLYMLIGLPGSGKSTWTNKLFELEALDALILSTDNYVQAWADEEGSTYDEVFDKAIRSATSQLDFWVRHCKKFNISAVWDQTNLTAKSRAKKLRQLPNHRKVAVVFQADAETLQQRRANRPGKTIPQHVLDHMKLEMPSLDEGFDEIILVNA